MNQEPKRLWIEALRSGKYKQTTGVLTRMDEDGELSYCCLGVACQVAIDNGVNLDVTLGEDDSLLYDGDAAGLPGPVIDWLGVYSPLPMTHKGDGLSTMNDIQRYPFSLIAEYIEWDM